LTPLAGGSGKRRRKVRRKQKGFNGKDKGSGCSGEKGRRKNTFLSLPVDEWCTETKDHRAVF